MQKKERNRRNQLQNIPQQLRAHKNRMGIKRNCWPTLIRSMFHCMAINRGVQLLISLIRDRRPTTNVH